MQWMFLLIALLFSCCSLRTGISCAIVDGPSRNLRSTNHNPSAVPRFILKTVGDRRFFYATPKTWNGVRRPRQIRGPKTRANAPPRGPC